MSSLSDDLMKQLRFIGTASSVFMSQKNQKLTGQDRVLVVVLEESDLTQSYLAEILDLRPSSLAELLKKMETNRDIVRVEDEQDKRVKHIQLTEQGRIKAEDLKQLASLSSSDAFLAGLDDQQKVQLGETIGRIIAGWSPEFRANSAKFVDPMDRLKAMQEMREEWFKNGEMPHKMSRHGFQDVFEKRFRDFHQRMHEENDHRDR